MFNLQQWYADRKVEGFKPIRIRQYFLGNFGLRYHIETLIPGPAASPVYRRSATALSAEMCGQYISALIAANGAMR